MDARWHHNTFEPKVSSLQLLSLNVLSHLDRHPEVALAEVVAVSMGRNGSITSLRRFQGHAEAEL